MVDLLHLTPNTEPFPIPLPIYPSTNHFHGAPQVSLMDFDCSFQSKKERKSDPSNLDFEEDFEDDVLYAEIRRRILLLTADDDDEDEDMMETRYRNSSNVVIKQSSNSFMSSFLEAKAQGWCNHFNWWENESSAAAIAPGSAPAWLSNLWRTGNGTGVFIPHIVKTRRKHRPGRMNNEGGRRYKQVENK